MGTETIKKQTAFRLSESLLNRLKENAKKENRSLSNYVECILLDSVYYELNDESLEALNEVKAGKYAGTVDISSMEAFIKSCTE